MKKRFLSLLFAFVLAVGCASFAGCSEVINGNKIQRMNMVIEFTNPDGSKDEKTIRINLYLNSAPETTKAFIKLAENGYYDGVCVNNVSNNVVEFGGYKRGEDGKLVKNEKQGEKIKGEFAAAGLTQGSLTTSSSGVLVMQRKKGINDAYDTATGNIAITTGSASGYYPTEDYCLFGRLDMSDSEKNPKESYSDSSKINRTGKNSLEVFKTITDLVTEKETDETSVTAYYDSLNDKYYTKVVTTDDDGTDTSWYEGLGADKVEILDKTAIENIEKKLTDDDEKYTFYTLTYTSVVIKSIRKA